MTRYTWGPPDYRPRLHSGVRLERAEEQTRRRWEAIRLYAVLYALALTGIVAILALGGIHA